LKKNFKLETSKRLNKGKWIIYFPKASLSNLRNLVDKHMLKEFKYKLIPYSEKLAIPVETKCQTPLLNG